MLSSVNMKFIISINPIPDVDVSIERFLTSFIISVINKVLKIELVVLIKFVYALFSIKRSILREKRSNASLFGAISTLQYYSKGVVQCNFPIHSYLTLHVARHFFRKHCAPISVVYNI